MNKKFLYVLLTSLAVFGVTACGSTGMGGSDLFPGKDLIQGSGGKRSGALPGSSFRETNMPMPITASAEERIRWLRVLPNPPG